MIETILAEPDLFGLCRNSCEENGMCVNLCDELLENHYLNHSKVIILKTDDFYSSRNMHNPPKSVDCLILVKEKDGFSVFLVELRKCQGTARVKLREVEPKFDTILNDFMGDRFREIFHNEEFKIKRFEMWLITDPFFSEHLSDEQYEKKVKSSALDQYNLMKPKRFRGKIASIVHKRPGPEICCNNG